MKRCMTSATLSAHWRRDFSTSSFLTVTVLFSSLSKPLLAAPYLRSASFQNKELKFQKSSISNTLGPWLLYKISICRDGPAAEVFDVWLQVTAIVSLKLL